MLDTIRAWRWPLLVGLAGWLTVAWTRADPGITADEPFNVVFGIDLVTRFCQRGSEFFTWASINETFSTRHEHPPLGRWVIGWTHWLMNGGRAPQQFGERDLLDARLAPATALALSLAILTRVISKRFDTLGGVTAGMSLLVMPRVFGHAHLAALDTFVCATYFLGVLTAGWMMEGQRSWLRAPLAGLGLGCALLTKMHGVFLLPVVGAWAVSRFGFRSIASLFLWGLVGLMVFYLGWQWLWGDLQMLVEMIRKGQLSPTSWIAEFPYTFSRTTAYFGSAIARSPIFVWYLGTTYRDSEVPWHYPWVLFAVSVPIGLHALSVCGVVDHFRRDRSNNRSWLFLVAWFLPLVIFSLPGIPVYDGVRMFLMVFPFWAGFAGQGATWIAKCIGDRWGPGWGTRVIGGILLSQAFGLWYYAPYHLSYYNMLTGGLRGASRLGLEVTYWGDSITRRFLDQWAAIAPDRTCAVLNPTLYFGQPDVYDSPGMRQKELRIFGPTQRDCPYLILYNRHAYLNDSLKSMVADPERRPVVEATVDGVWVSRVYARPLADRAEVNGGRIDDEPAAQPF